METYEKVQVLSQVLEETANQRCQMNDVCRFVLFKKLQGLFFIS
jgi:hypothetical protein